MNSKNILLFMVAVVATRSAACQEESGRHVENVSRVTLLSPGFSYEQKLGKATTLFGHAFLSPHVSFNYSELTGFESDFTLEPTFALQYRYYYNYAKRQEKGQRTAMNSMNYLAPVYRCTFSKRAITDNYVAESSSRPINTIGMIWGLQRNLEKRFSLDFSAGLGYQFSTGTRLDNMGNRRSLTVQQVSILSGITLGFWLNRQTAD